MNGDNENHVLFPTKHTQRAMAVVGGRGGCVPPDVGPAQWPPFADDQEED